MDHTTGLGYVWVGDIFCFGVRFHGADRNSWLGRLETYCCRENFYLDPYTPTLMCDECDGIYSWHRPRTLERFTMYTISGGFVLTDELSPAADFIEKLVQAVDLASGDPIQGVLIANSLHLLVDEILESKGRFIKTEWQVEFHSEIPEQDLTGAVSAAAHRLGPLTAH